MNADNQSGSLPLADDHADLVVEVFRMLADATRVQLLWALADGEMSVNDLADRVGKPGPSVSQHLAKLRLARLVRPRRRGRLMRVGRSGHLPLAGDHDHAEHVDAAPTTSAAGIRAVKISLLALAATAIAQLVVVAFSGSVALFADTVHNFSDALTALPLWIAFAVGRRAATRRYPYGLGRAEDLAGLFVVAVIAVSASVAAVDAVHRLIEPAPLNHLILVAAGGVVGFIGNELVAIYRIGVGTRIGSAALRADGLHARVDGLTSLAVVLGAGGVAA